MRCDNCEAIVAAIDEMAAEMASQQAIHEQEMARDGRARAAMVALCRELDAPIYEDPAQGIRHVVAHLQECAEAIINLLDADGWGDDPRDAERYVARELLRGAASARKGY